MALNPQVREGDAPLTTLNYMKRETAMTSYLGMPGSSWNPYKIFKQTKALIGIGSSNEKHQVHLHDARAAMLDYKECGFCLQPLRSAVEKWERVTFSGSKEHKLYCQELESVIRRLHPEVVKIEFSSFLLRGKDGNPPASGAIHLDYYPDLTTIEEFLERKKHSGGFNDFGKFKDMPSKRHPDLKLGMVLGLWKPRNKVSPVCESPLIMCDPATVDFVNDVIPQEQDFQVNTEGSPIHVINVAGSLKYSERNTWYYYPEQTSEEVTVFRHYTEDNWHFANFHCAGELPLPAGREKRSSVETRAFLFFKRD